MRLTVKLFAYFRDNRFVRREMDFPEGSRVEDIIRSCDIDLGEVGVTMINSRHCELSQVPQDNDQLAVFPTIGGG
jgi:sulfur-carrier protein